MNEWMENVAKMSKRICKKSINGEDELYWIVQWNNSSVKSNTEGNNNKDDKGGKIAGAINLKMSLSRKRAMKKDIQKHLS